MSYFDIASPGNRKRSRLTAFLVVMSVSLKFRTQIFFYNFQKTTGVISWNSFAAQNTANETCFNHNIMRN